mgnify:CR=1 FL=1
MNMEREAAREEKLDGKAKEKKNSERRRERKAGDEEGA